MMIWSSGPVDRAFIHHLFFLCSQGCLVFFFSSRRRHTRWISWGSLGLPSETVPNLCLLVGRVVLAKRQPTLVIRVYWGVLHPGEGNHETAARRRVGSVRRRHRASARLVRITAPCVAGCLRCDERRGLLASRQRRPGGGRNRPRRVP